MTNDIEIISRKEAKKRGLKRYFTGKACKHGHVAERRVSDGGCRECRAEYNNKNKDKEAKRKKDYYNQNKDKIADRDRVRYNQNKDKRAEYLKRNKDKIVERKKDYYNKNKDKIAEWWKEYYNKNKGRIAERKKDYYNKNKDKIVELGRMWRKQNPAQIFLRGSLNRMLGNWKGGRKKMEKLHGYTFEQLVTRIEFQFKDGMSWDNRSEWHIDHKKPIARFLEQGVTDPKIVNALSNLRPMWASENLSKGAKFEL